jgi:hypothetical protein
VRLWRFTPKFKSLNAEILGKSHTLLLWHGRLDLKYHSFFDTPYRVTSFLTSSVATEEVKKWIEKLISSKIKKCSSIKVVPSNTYHEKLKTFWNVDIFFNFQKKAIFCSWHQRKPKKQKVVELIKFSSITIHNFYGRTFLDVVRNQFSINFLPLLQDILSENFTFSAISANASSKFFWCNNLTFKRPRVASLHVF